MVTVKGRFSTRILMPAKQNLKSGGFNVHPGEGKDTMIKCQSGCDRDQQLPAIYGDTERNPKTMRDFII